jgi:DNA repair protein RadA/Sms
MHGALQVRECATALLHVAKRQGVPMFLVGHVTKTGDIAGTLFRMP